MKNLVFLLVCFSLSAVPLLSRASVIVDVTEESGNVTFDVNGSLDLTGAHYLGIGMQGNGLISGGANWYIATGDVTNHDEWELESIEVPFGTNTSLNTSFSLATGDTFGIWGEFGGTPRLLLGRDYVSGDAIRAVLSFSGETLSGLGLISGVYKFEIPSDYIELRIGQFHVVVPEPSSLALLGLGLLGLGMFRRPRVCLPIPNWN